MPSRKVSLKIAALALLFALPQPLRADPAGPEYPGVFVQWDAATGRQASLERQTARERVRVKALGFGGATVEYEFPGLHSPTRFRVGRPLTFLLRVENQSRDPHVQIQFYRLGTTKNSRRLVLASGGAFSGGREKYQDNVMSFDAAKYGHDFFRISPANPLPPGEYALSTPDSKDGFLFGVDP